MKNPAFCICENKDADQLCGDREADQSLCFRYTDRAVPLLSKSEISSLKPSCVVVQPGSCGTWSETSKTGFLTTRLKLFLSRPRICSIKVQNLALFVNRDDSLKNYRSIMRTNCFAIVPSILNSYVEDQGSTTIKITQPFPST